METEVAAAEPSQEHAPEDSGSFWKSASGVITGITGLVGAITALVAGLSQAGVIGHRKDPHPIVSPSPSPSPNAAFTPSSDPDDDSDLRAYRVFAPGDGFSWVRKEPTKESPGVATLVSGTPVKCRDAVSDPDPSTGRKWHYCPAEGGYISTRLLKPAIPAS